MPSQSAGGVIQAKELDAATKAWMKGPKAAPLPIKKEHPM